MKDLIVVSPNESLVLFFEKMAQSASVNVVFVKSVQQICLNAGENCLAVVINLPNPTLEELSILYKVQKKLRVPYVFLAAGADEEETELDSLASLFSLMAANHANKNCQEMIPLAPDVIFDPVGKTIWHHGEQYMLTMTEYRLLQYLLECGDRTCDINQIIDKVWGIDNFATSNTVYVHIRKLREKIESDPSNPKILVTCHGIGYKINVSHRKLSMA